MANALFKFVRSTYTAGSPGVPSDPGSPATSAQTVWEEEEVCGLEPAVPGRWEWVPGTLANGYAPVRRFVPNDPTMTIIGFHYVCHNELVPRHVPAQPYIPPTPGVAPTAAQTTYDFDLGWNASAVSIDSLPADGYATFTVPFATIGVVIGLALAGSTSNSYSDISHAFYVSHGVVRVYEHGAEKFYAGGDTAPRKLEIRRGAGVVTYVVDGSAVYTSTLNSSGPVWLECWLYSGGDTVYDPVMERTQSLAIEMPPLMVLGSDAVIAQAVMTLPMFALSAGTTPTTALVLPAPTVFASDGPFAAAQLVLPAFTISGGAAGVVPSYAIANGVLPGLTLSATGLTGEIGSAELTLPSMWLLASDHPYGEAMLELPAPWVYGSAYEGAGNASFGNRVTAEATLAGAALLAVVMTSSGTVASVLSYALTHDASVESSVTAGSSMVLSAVLQAVMDTEVSATTALPPQSDEYEVWVLNMDSGASTSYENFPFNSFGTLGGEYLGVTTDGVYLLDGDDDAGDPIRASLNFGKHDFGSSEMKRVPHCYLGVSSTGVMCLKVTVNGEEFVYTARNHSEELSTRRVDLGRGLRANYMTFELYNQDGCDFDLETVEFDVVPISRRI